MFISHINLYQYVLHDTRSQKYILIILMFIFFSFLRLSESTATVRFLLNDVNVQCKAEKAVSVYSTSKQIQPFGL